MTSTPEVKLDLNGNVYTLRLDLNALEALEAEMGMTLQEFGKSISEKSGMSIKEIKVLIFACMRSEHPEITLNDLGRMIHYKNIHVVQETIGDLLEDDDEKNA